MTANEKNMFWPFSLSTRSQSFAPALLTEARCPRWLAGLCTVSRSASVSLAWNTDTAHQSSRDAAEETCRATALSLGFCQYEVGQLLRYMGWRNVKRQINLSAWSAFYCLFPWVVVDCIQSISLNLTHNYKRSVIWNTGQNTGPTNSFLWRRNLFW